MQNPGWLFVLIGLALAYFSFRRLFVHGWTHIIIFKALPKNHKMRDMYLRHGMKLLMTYVVLGVAAGINITYGIILIKSELSNCGPKLPEKNITAVYEKTGFSKPVFIFYYFFNLARRKN